MAVERQCRRKAGMKVGRAVGRSENPARPVVMWWAQSALQVEIGLTDLKTFRGAMASSAPTALKWKDAEFLSNQET